MGANDEKVGGIISRMKGFNIDVKGQKRRMKYQAEQQLRQAEVHQPEGTEQTKGSLNKFVSRLIK